TAIEQGVGVDLSTIEARWNALLDDTLAQATLTRPTAGGYVSTGKHAVHSEHLGFVLGEMQSLARAHPEAVW
ncbi:MAG: phenylacetate-CoA oxygenase subunit PaaI, partial [Rhodoferax sp.]|nr:phenylacetate-CoA oxygenase subunit PaaI [Rhodoferax sp.]